MSDWIPREKSLLNLKEIEFFYVTGYSSRRCSGNVSFIIDCSTEKGYHEDPDFEGSIEIAETKEDGDYVWLKTKFKPNKDDD